MSTSSRPHVVIIGGGFGGMTAARTLRDAPVDITLIDRTNHHLFQPLLYQVATATLNPGDITAPVRHLLRKQRNVNVVLAEVREIDTDRRVVLVDDERRAIAYDYLIVAAGVRHSYFGHDEWEQYAPGLKSIEDAVEIRRRFLMAFELADKTTDAAERDALMTFVVVGGGPTGLELAGLMPGIARRALRAGYRNIDTSRARVILLEASTGVLPDLPPELGVRAVTDLADLGVEVRLNARVTNVTNDSVYIGDQRIPTRTVIWAAGTIASPLARALRAPLDSVGRVKVQPDLSIPGHPEVFVVGDMAATMQKNGKPVPAVAPAANQQGKVAAQNILHTMRREARKTFVYFNKGNLATLGRHRAVGDFGPLRFTGALAWLAWLFIHILYLAGFKNRLSVLFQWMWSYVTYERGVRLITDTDRHLWSDAHGPIHPKTLIRSDFPVAPPASGAPTSGAPMGAPRTNGRARERVPANIG